ncbi:hypothetical protein MNBD_ALPHA11-1153, partial [hydrothermal vent metagenome]
SLDGGSGIDIADYSASGSGVTVNLDGSASAGGDAAGDTLTSIERVIGSAFADTLNGSVANETLEGGAGDDILNGGAGNDTLVGGADNDTLIGGAGADSLDGGSGIDIADYSASSAGVNVNMDGTISTGGDAAGDTLTSIEQVTGSAFADTLSGTGGVDTINGGGGDDVVIGGAGADNLDGGADVDTLDYSASGAGVTINLASNSAAGGDAAGDIISNFENVTGSTSADNLVGNGGSNVLTGGAGDDILNGGAGDDSLIGGADDDTLIGGAGADSLDGGSGIDIADYSASGSGVTVNLDGSASAGGDAAGDTLTSIERVIGSAFADTLNGSVANETLEGGAGDDILNGGAGNDTLVGGADNDTLIGGAGADSLDGGSGIDIADYSASSAGVNVNMDGTISTGGDAAGDTLTSIEQVTGSAFADTLSGTGGVDTINGGGGDDVVIGGAGADNLDGGADVDTLDYSASGAGVTINLASNSAAGGDAAGDIISNFENVTGSTSADNLVGNGGSNVLTGGAGDDILNGGAGNDTLVGGADDDTLIGGAGADSLDGGSGIDIADYSASGSGVTVNLDGSASAGGDAAGDTLTSIETVLGSSFNDTLNGTGAAETLNGGAGNDIITGGGGSDVLIGGAGNDSFLVGGPALNLGGFSLDGGDDTDTVTISGAGTIDNEVNLDAVLSDVEIIDFTGAGVNADLNLSAADIQGMTDGSNILEFDFDGGDSVSITDPVANWTETTIGSTTTYDIYTDATQTVQMAQLIVNS